MAMPHFHLTLIKNVEDPFSDSKNVFFLYVFPIKKCASNFHRETVKQFRETKHWYLIHSWSDKAFKDTVVNQVLPSLHGGPIEITLTVPFKPGQ